jgi:hypothetical protein
MNLPHDHWTDDICNAVETLSCVHEIKTLFEQRIGFQAPDSITHGPWRQPGFFNNVFLGEIFTRFEHLKHQLR